MKKPKAVLISDIHFSIPTLEVATKVLTEALFQAQRIMVPLIIAGDLLDGKSIIQGKVANRLIEIFSSNNMVKVYILVGNHDLLNEKGTEHALNFLDPYALIIDEFMDNYSGIYYLPYYSDQEKLKATLKRIPDNSTIICHQGVQGANMGHYIQDTSSISLEYFKNFRTISGHYHKKQDLENFSYLGSPYTTSFSEAGDGPKGFSVLYDDGSLELWPVTTRKHIIVEESITRFSNNQPPIPGISQGDLIWLKLSGPSSLLKMVNKKVLGEQFLGTSNYKLELKYNGVMDRPLTTPQTEPTKILDTLIMELKETDEQKKTLTSLYKELLK